jgi:hypothetical protein
MTFVINDRVKETTTTSGTGAIALDGAVTGFQSFQNGIGSGNSTYYTIAGGNQWEVGIGSMPNSTTLTRDSIISSSDGNSIVTFLSGQKDVFCTLPATRTPSPVMTPQQFVNTHNSTISDNQTLDSGVLAGPVSITGTLTATGNLVIV